MMKEISVTILQLGATTDLLIYSEKSRLGLGLALAALKMTDQRLDKN